MKTYLKLLILKLIQFAQSYKPKFAKCGENVVIGWGFEINRPDRLFLGSHIYIGPKAVFNSLGGIRIHTGVIVGPNLHIYSVNHKYTDGIETLPFDSREILKPVEIHRYVWIGGDVIIVPGVTIGEGAVVGAGSVVVKDVPPLAVVAGSPAKVMKYRNNEEYHKLASQKMAIYSIKKQKDLRITEIGQIPEKWFIEDI